MTDVWIAATDGVLIRSNSIAVLYNRPNGLHAGTITGEQLRLTKSETPYTSLMHLLDEFRSAEYEVRNTITLVYDDDEHKPSCKRVYPYEVK